MIKGVSGVETFVRKYILILVEQRTTMGIHQEKYTREYFTGVDAHGNPVGYGATLESDEHGRLKLRTHDQRILEAINFSGKTVLDIGFGRGEAIVFAYQNGASRCTGVDFSEAALEIAKKLITEANYPDLDLIQADALEYVCEYAEKFGNDLNHKFDIILMLNFVEHVPRSELREMMVCLKKIISQKAIIAINTPAYKYDNDVIQNGFDDRNLEDCFDTSDLIPETVGLHCNKFSSISLQQFMSSCGFINLSEAHFLVDKDLFGVEQKNMECLAYSERWKQAQVNNIPLKGTYRDDVVEFPYTTTQPSSLIEFTQGNMAGLSIFITDEYKELATSGENYDEELFASLKPDEIENQVVFDVGGFMGISSLILANQVGPNGKVITFEPNPWNLNRILINLSHNQDLAKKVNVYPYALGDVNNITRMTLSFDIDKGYSSTSRINISHPKIPKDSLPEGFFETDVELRTLDWFVETHGIIPNVLKIDIEGAEHFLLRGGIQTLVKHKPMLFIELHSEFCTLQCTLLLLSLSYNISILKEEADNRLMIKAEYNIHDAQKNYQANDAELLEMFKLQHEAVINYKNLIKNEEDLHQTLQAAYQSLLSKHRSLVSENQSLQTTHQALVLEYQSLQATHQALVSEDQSLLASHQSLELAHQSLVSDFQSLQTNHQSLLISQQNLNETYLELMTNYKEILNSRTVRYSSKIKEIFWKLKGTFTTKQ
jgi:FkbM family methyltransferase